MRPHAPHPQLDGPLKARLLGLRNADWSRIVVDACALHGRLTPAELVRGWEAHMATLYPQARLLPGAERLTAHLFRHAVPLCLCTSSGSHAVELKRRSQPDLFRRFRHIITGDDSELERGKPAPDIYLLAARRVGVDARHCLVIEDALYERAIGGGGARKAPAVHPVCAAAVPDAAPA